MKIPINLIFFLAALQVSAQPECKFLPKPYELYESLKKRPTNIDYRDYRMGCNVNDSVKDRLIYLLKNPVWTDTQIDAALNMSAASYKEQFGFDEKVKKISHGIDSLKKHIEDSLNKIIRVLRIKEMGEEHYFDIHKGLTRTIAVLNIKEVIPFLQDIHKKQPKFYQISEVELALARLGDSAMIQKVFKDCRPDSNWTDFERTFDIAVDKLYFIKSQESFCEFTYWIDTVHTISGRKEYQRKKFAGYVIYTVNEVILNKEFIDIFRGYDLLEDEIPNNIILDCKKWLIENKGKYQFNKNKPI